MCAIISWSKSRPFQEEFAVHGLIQATDIRRRRPAYSRTRQYGPSEGAMALVEWNEKANEVDMRSSMRQ